MAEYLASKAQRDLPRVAASRGTEAERLDTFTALPGRIVSFDPASQRATVKVMYKPRLNGEVRDFPDLLEVPVVMPRAGGFAVTFPVAAGDGVQLVFQSRSAEAWYEDGEASEAPQARAHDLSDAVAMVGMEPKPRILPNYDPTNMTVTGPNGTMTMTPAGDFQVENPNGTMKLAEDGEFKAENAFGLFKMDAEGLFEMTGGADGEDAFTTLVELVDILIASIAVGGGGVFNPTTLAALTAVKAKLSSITLL